MEFTVSLSQGSTFIFVTNDNNDNAVKDRPISLNKYIIYQDPDFFMSFKRDGNDTNLLSILQKRRIKDLLAEEIPEKEAKLLSNGRFACLVCSHHPVFDTVSMLTVHRQAKKHKYCVEIQERKKYELKQLIAKRKQEQALKNASSSIPVASMHHAGLSLSSPYDPRVRKHKVKRGDRKIQVDLHDPATSSQVSESEHPTETKDSSTTASSSRWLEVAEQQMNGPIMHDNKLKNIFTTKKENERIHISPYTPRVRANNREHVSMATTRNNDEVNEKCFSFSETSQYTPSQGQPHLTVPVCSDRHQNISVCSSRHLDEPSPVPGFNPLVKPVRHQSNANPPPPATISTSSCPKRSLEFSGTGGIKSKKRDKGIATSVQKSALPERDAVAEKYYQLQGSGWKRDWDGKWVKDEQAEFDSDEEPPTLP